MGAGIRARGCAGPRLRAAWATGHCAYDGDMPWNRRLPTHALRAMPRVVRVCAVTALLGLAVAACEDTPEPLIATPSRDGGGGDGGRAGGATESDGRRSRAGGDCASRDAGTDGSRTRPDRPPASSRSAGCDGQCDAEPYARAAARAPGRRSDGPIERGRQPNRARDGIAGGASGRSGPAGAAGSGGVGVPGALRAGSPRPRSRFERTPLVNCRRWCTTWRRRARGSPRRTWTAMARTS